MALQPTIIKNWSSIPDSVQQYCSQLEICQPDQKRLKWSLPLTAWWWRQREWKTGRGEWGARPRRRCCAWKLGRLAKVAWNSETGQTDSGKDQNRHNVTYWGKSEEEIETAECSYYVSSITSDTIIIIIGLWYSTYRTMRNRFYWSELMPCCWSGFPPPRITTMWSRKSICKWKSWQLTFFA